MLLNSSTFVLNDYMENNENYMNIENRSSHWSLAVYKKRDNSVYHLQSSHSHNHIEHLINNIGLHVPVTLRISNVECGLHILVNCSRECGIGRKSSTAQIY